MSDLATKLKMCKGFIGENNQIPRFGKICDKLALFQKYLAIYQLFST